MSLIRAFIAIELDSASLEALSAVQARLKKQPGAQAVKWVAAGGIHLTLKFIGDLESGRIPQVLEAVQRAVAGESPFGLVIQDLGGFPNLQRPNVVWAGVRGQTEIASRIAQRLEEGCARLGIAREERPFTPHLTLGRVRREAGPDERRLVGDAVRRLQSGAFGRLTVGAVSLMRSELRPAGAVYSELGRAPLGAG
jgi:2'-5' RNA ligase